MVVAELVALVLVAIVGGLVIALWAADRDEHLDAWGDIDILWALVVTSIGGGIALRLALLPFPFGSVLGALVVLVVWTPLLGLATSRRHRVLRRILGIPIGVIVALRGGLQP